MSKKFIYLLLFFVFVLNFYSAFAQTLKYSKMPECENMSVICNNENEVPVCLTLFPKVHLEKIALNENYQINRFQPHCFTSIKSKSPSCFDLNTKNKMESSNIAVECIEFIKCKYDKNKNELIPTCSEGKTPRCLGNSSIPSCKNKTICNKESIPICDYIWQASKNNTLYH